MPPYYEDYSNAVGKNSHAQMAVSDLERLLMNAKELKEQRASGEYRANPSTLHAKHTMFVSTGGSQERRQ